MFYEKPWILKTPDKNAYEELLYRGFLPPLIARILASRGFSSVSQAYSFLYPEISDFSDPFLLKGIEEAVKRIEKAYLNKEKIAIYGDSDADGILGSFTLYHFLKNFFSEIEVIIPSKELEGYGFHAKFLPYLKEKGVNLIITVDVGISSSETVEQAKALGIDVIITDHHEITSLPRTYVVSGKLAPKDSPFYFLCGAGVAFLFIRAIRSYFYHKGYLKNSIPNLRQYLEIVSLATLADMVPIKGENRLITFFGFRDLASPSFPAIKVLVQKYSQFGEITEEDLSFKIIPLINAAGRMGKPEIVFQFLCAKEETEAENLLTELELINTLRQEKEISILEELEREIPLFEHKENFLLLSKEGLPKGLLGLVANKLKNSYGVPVVVIGLENGVGYASARAPKGFDLFSLIKGCQDLIIQFGGHSSALGFTIKRENIEALTKRLASLIQENSSLPKNEGEVFFVDAEAKISEILEKETKAALMQLPPFGEAHAPPLLLLKDFEIERVKVLKEKHSRLELKEAEFKMSAICFNKVFKTLPKAILACPQYNPYRNCLELKIQDAY